MTKEVKLICLKKFGAIFRDGKFGVSQNGEKALEILRVPASKEFDAINKVTALRMIAEIYQ